MLSGDQPGSKHKNSVITQLFPSLSQTLTYCLSRLLWGLWLLRFRWWAVKNAHKKNSSSKLKTYKNQSIARIRPMSSVGRFTAWRTIIMVTRPADGMPAAPIAAAVAVKLAENYWRLLLLYTLSELDINSDHTGVSQYFLESISHVPSQGGRCNIWSHHLNLE